MRKINYSLFLKNLDYFKGVSEQVIKIIDSRTGVRKFNPGMELMNQKNDEDVLYIIYSGEISLIIEKDTKVTPIKTLTSGSIFPLEHLFQSKISTIHAIATKETTLLSVPMGLLETLIKDHPNLVMNSIKELQKNIENYYRLFEQM